MTTVMGLKGRDAEGVLTETYKVNDDGVELSVEPRSLRSRVHGQEGRLGTRRVEHNVCRSGGVSGGDKDRWRMGILEGGLGDYWKDGRGLAVERARRDEAGRPVVVQLFYPQ